MSSFLALIALALLAVPFVVLARRPGWDQVRPTHPDAARLAAERDAVESWGADQRHGPTARSEPHDQSTPQHQSEPTVPPWRPAA
ncbi:MAG: hypothetical protein KJ792_08050 [Actinobacteria bacterium]|nr:hypothetical protein [Actinomycetota bacterium]MCG2802692.1 hypothetical protein [Cellulomonas sp.]